MTSFWGHQDNPFPPDEPDYPICPVCGEECGTIYKVGNAVVAADNCIVEVNAWEWQEEQEEQ